MKPTAPTRPAWHPDPAAIAAIVEGRHDDPFSVLGMHGGGEHPLSVRVFSPGAESVTVIDLTTGQNVADLQKLHPAGFFAGPIEAALRLSSTGFD